MFLIAFYALQIQPSCNNFEDVFEEANKKGEEQRTNWCCYKVFCVKSNRLDVFGTSHKSGKNVCVWATTKKKKVLRQRWSSELEKFRIFLFRKVIKLKLMKFNRFFLILNIFKSSLNTETIILMWQKEGKTFINNLCEESTMLLFPYKTIFFFVVGFIFLFAFMKEKKKFPAYYGCLLLLNMNMTDNKSFDWEMSYYLTWTTSDCHQLNAVERFDQESIIIKVWNG